MTKLEYIAHQVLIVSQNKRLSWWFISISHQLYYAAMVSLVSGLPYEVIQSISLLYLMPTICGCATTSPTRSPNLNDLISCKRTKDKFITYRMPKVYIIYKEDNAKT